MQTIARTGKFVGSQGRGFTRIGTDLGQLWGWAVLGASNPRLVHRYVVGVPLRKGTIHEAIRRGLAGRDGPTFDFLWIDVDFVNASIIPNPTLRLF